jgi:hypothetical protein
MKNLSFPCLFFLAALLFTGCAGSSPTVVKQEVVGHWVDRRPSDAGQSTEGQTPAPSATINALILRPDGTYENTFSKSKPGWLIGKSTGTWEVTGKRLVLNQTKVESGLVPKNPNRKITYQIVSVSQATLSLERNSVIESYARKD